MFIVMIKDLASASNQHLQLPYEVHTIIAIPLKEKEIM